LSLREKRLRGQAYSIDFAAAVLVFVLAFAFFLSFWQNSILSANAAIGRNRLGQAALAASDALVLTSGYPENWEANASAAQSIGLAYPGLPHSLSAAKLSNFTGIDYEKNRALLGLEGGFYFYVESADGGRIYEAGNSTVSGGRAVSIARIAVLDGKKVRLRLVAHG